RLGLVDRDPAPAGPPPVPIRGELRRSVVAHLSMLKRPRRLCGSVWAGAGRGSDPAGHLADHLARVLVRAQALEARRPQLAPGGPLRELDLGDQPRLDEVGTARRPADVEGRG